MNSEGDPAQGRDTDIPTPSGPPAQDQGGEPAGNDTLTEATRREVQNHQRILLDLLQESAVGPKPAVNPFAALIAMGFEVDHEIGKHRLTWKGGKKKQSFGIAEDIIGSGEAVVGRALQLYTQERFGTRALPTTYNLQSRLERFRAALDIPREHVPILFAEYMEKYSEPENPTDVRLVENGWVTPETFVLTKDELVGHLRGIREQRRPAVLYTPIDEVAADAVKQTVRSMIQKKDHTGHGRFQLLYGALPPEREFYGLMPGPECEILIRDLARFMHKAAKTAAFDVVEEFINIYHATPVEEPPVRREDDKTAQLALMEIQSCEAHGLRPLADRRGWRQSFDTACGMVANIQDKTALAAKCTLILHIIAAFVLTKDDAPVNAMKRAVRKLLGQCPTSGEEAPNAREVAEHVMAIKRDKIPPVWGGNYRYPGQIVRNPQAGAHSYNQESQGTPGFQGISAREAGQ